MMTSVILGVILAIVDCSWKAS